MATSAETVLNGDNQETLVVGCQRVATYAGNIAVDAANRWVDLVLQLQTGAGASVAGSESDVVWMAGGHVKSRRCKA